MLSGKFDEEKKLEPLKCGRVEDIKRTYEKQLQKLNRMGVDMTQSEVRDLELSELLAQTSNMTADAARQQYDEFVEDTKGRVDGIIYRLRQRYNIGKKLNSINKQSQLAQKTFNDEMLKQKKKSMSSQESLEEVPKGKK